MKNPIRIAINATAIQNGRLLNAGLQHQCYNILLSKEQTAGYTEIITNIASTALQRFPAPFTFNLTINMETVFSSKKLVLIYQNLSSHPIRQYS
jgi:hypothetical protein